MWNQASAREEKISNMTVKLKFAREKSWNFAREYFQKSAREDFKIEKFHGEKKLHGEKNNGLN